MANLYGVANCPGQPGQQLTVGAADVTCNPGVETNVITSPVLLAPSPGYFYVWASGILTLAIGATAPTNIAISIRIGAGADSMGFNINSFLLVANTALMVPIALYTPESQVPWQGAGSTVSITVNPTAQLVIARLQGTSVCLGLLRGTDV